MKRLVIATVGLGLAGCGNTGPAKEAVGDQLKDPSSAQFKEVRRTDGVVCGEVNAKNSFGAYEGFRRFFVVDGAEAVLEPAEEGAAKEYFGVAFSLRCPSSD